MMTKRKDDDDDDVVVVVYVVVEELKKIIVIRCADIARTPVCVVCIKAAIMMVFSVVNKQQKRDLKIDKIRVMIEKIHMDREEEEEEGKTLDL